jgi:hypothetical protein
VVAILQRGVLVACVFVQMSQREHIGDHFLGHDVLVYDIMNVNINEVMKRSLHYFTTQGQDMSKVAFLRPARLL